jgi:hypothetical protein
VNCSATRCQEDFCRAKYLTDFNLLKPPSSGSRRQEPVSSKVVVSEAMLRLCSFDKLQDTKAKVGDVFFEVGIFHFYISHPDDFQAVYLPYSLKAGMT